PKQAPSRSFVRAELEEGGPTGRVHIEPPHALGRQRLGGRRRPYRALTERGGGLHVVTVGGGRPLNGGGTFALSEPDRRRGRDRAAVRIIRSAVVVLPDLGLSQSPLPEAKLR